MCVSRNECYAANPWDSGQGCGYFYGRAQTVSSREVCHLVSVVVAHCLGLGSGRAKVVPHLLGTVTKDVLLPVIQVDGMRADGQHMKGS